MELSEIEVFCGAWLGFNPRSYQKAFLNDCLTKKRIVAIWCRQTGKSTCVAAYALWKALTTDNYSILVIAHTQAQSSELFNKIRSKVEANDDLRGYVEGETSATRIKFKNGSRIISLPTGDTGSTIHGYTANTVILEEAGFIKDDIVNTAIMPMIAATDGQVIKIGTPHTKNHFYASAYKDDTYIFHQVTCWMAIEAGQIAKSVIDEARANITDMEFSHQYLAEFIDESSLYLPPKIVDPCQDENIETERCYYKSTYYLGVDFARQGEDSTVLTIFEVEWKDGLGRVLKTIEINKKPLTYTVGYIRMLDEKYNFNRITLDETGMGAGPTDVLRESAIGAKIDAITFTIKSKMDIYSNLRVLFETGKIKIPTRQQNPKLYNQLTTFEYELIETSGQMKLHHPERGHDDYCDSLALAAYPLKPGTESNFFMC